VVTVLSKSRRFGRRRFDVRPDTGAVAGHLYGAIIVLAVLLPASDLDHGPIKVAAVLATTVGVLLGMEAFAEAVAQEVALRRALTQAERMGVVRRFLSVTSAAEAPLVFLLLAALDILSMRAAFRLAEAATLALIFYYGFEAGRLAGRPKRTSITRALGVVGVGAALAIGKGYIHL
jgi:hypothetical protein